MASVHYIDGRLQVTAAGCHYNFPSYYASRRHTVCVNVKCHFETPSNSRFKAKERGLQRYDAAIIDVVYNRVAEDVRRNWWDTVREAEFDIIQEGASGGYLVFRSWSVAPLSSAAYNAEAHCDICNDPYDVHTDDLKCLYDGTQFKSASLTTLDRLAEKIEEVNSSLPVAKEDFKEEYALAITEERNKIAAMLRIVRQTNLPDPGLFTALLTPTGYEIFRRVYATK